MPKCPYCTHSVARYIWRNVDLETGADMQTQTLRGLEVSCPSCKQVISVILNPDVQARLTAEQIKSR